MKWFRPQSLEAHIKENNTYLEVIELHDTLIKFKE
jgi:hypothetical protein